MPVQRQPRLQPQRVPGAEPGGRHAGGEHRIPEVGRPLGGDGALHAVLARVAGPGNQAVDAVPGERGHAEPPDRGRVGCHAGQPVPGRGPLHGDDGPGRGDVLTQAERGDHPIGVGRVGHDVEAALVDPPDDDVVEYRGVAGIEQMGVLRPARRHLPEVVGERPLQAVERVGTLDPHGPEMADVEGHGIGAAGLVLGDGARRVRQRHLPSSELDHARAEGAVSGVERRVLEGHRAAACGSPVRDGRTLMSLRWASTSSLTLASERMLSTP